MAGLIAFLYEQARARRVTLGGLDDQLGSLNAFYSLEEMPAELGRDIGGAPGEQCAGQLRQRIWSRYTKEGPYTPNVREKLLACLAEARRAVDASAADAEDRSDLLFMIDNFVRYLARDNLKMAELVPARDFSMYQNLRALEARLPAGTKAIIWAANAHVAKDPARNPSWPKGRNLGSYVNQAFGARAFVLGFTAASGSFRWDRTVSRPIDPAQPGSLEAQALAGTGAASVYLGPTKLGKLGAVVGSAFDDHKPVSARWSEVYDGIVVFRAERPTEQAAS
jgi:erythromycin esterase-like protein